VIGPRPDVTGFGAGRSAVGDESNLDLYGEARLPLVRDEGKGRALELGVGYRLSEYEQAGSADAYKPSSRSSRDSSCCCAARNQHAVRAPSIEELYYPEVAGQFLFEPPDPAASRVRSATGPTACRSRRCASPRG